MDDLVIRPAVLGDADAIGQMWEKLVTYHRELDMALPRSAPNGARLYAQRIREKVGDSHTGIFVAEVKNKPVGFVLGLIVDLVPEMFAPEIAGFLADIYVETGFRRTGIGRALVQALSDWFQSRGVGYIELYVANSNVEGRAFWASLGGRDMMRRVRVPLNGENDD